MKCDAARLEAIAQDSNFHDLGVLPSNGVAYKGRMDKLFIRPLRLPELQLISRAAQLKDVSHLIRAVDNCISHSVYDLTIGDFYYVLLWLKIYGMPKTPYIIEWRCEQPFYTHKETKAPLLYNMTSWPEDSVVESDYNEAPCGTENTSVVHKADCEILMLDENLVLPEGYDFPRVAILAEMTAALLNPDMVLLVPALQWIEGPTWQSKIARAEEDLDTISMGLDLNKRLTHGVSETVTYECRQCRVPHTSTLTLNALTFFR